MSKSNKVNYIGIDVGLKRVGISFAHHELKIALPLDILTNDSHLIEKIISLIDEKEVGVVVLGLSLNNKNEHNTITSYVNHIGDSLKKHYSTAIEIVFQDERYTSVEARKLTGKKNNIDAHSAQLILQSYINKMQNKLK